MATRMGAQALFIDHLTGSLEPGKRADLICVELDDLHHQPHFMRDPNGIYAQLVYTGKSTDVTDVMVDGSWLMKSRKLTSIDEHDIVHQSQDVALKIDAFLLEREESVISKLIAIGGASQEESFEVQVKVRMDNLQPYIDALIDLPLDIIRKRHYNEYDSYFSFSNPEQGYLRYREDHFVAEDGNITHVRSRLTHIGLAEREQFSEKVLLSRSRYIAPATQSLRFYREYFQPVNETEIEKERIRFQVRYKDTEFFINFDSMKNPVSGNYLEIKSRTWSKKDANKKAHLALELLHELGAHLGETIYDDYIKMVD